MKRKRVRHHNTEPSLTKQSFADEANVNKIMARYEKTGELPTPSKRAPRYGDFSEVSDYRQALDQIRDAEDRFLSLPANVRRFFNNDAAEFVEFASNPENEDQMIKFGLMDAKASTKLSDEEKPKPAPIPTKEAKNDDKTTNKSSDGKDGVPT